MIRRTGGRVILEYGDGGYDTATLMEALAG
jgi:hypothetical protein